MKFSVKFSPEALRDLDEIYDYISNTLKSPVAADHTVNKILGKTDFLAENPEIGTQLFFENDLYSGYRYMVSDNYLFFTVYPAIRYMLTELYMANVII